MTSLILALLLLQLPLNQTGTIDGIVIKAGTTEPLSGTKIGLTRIDGGAPTNALSTIPTGGAPPAPTQTATTGTDGRFRFTDLAPGLYRINASRSDGYMPAEYGQTRPGVRGRPIRIDIGGAAKDLQVPMSPTATVTGRVLDRDGDPIGQSQVVALRAVYDRDGRRVQTITQSVQTNDNGEYRLFWLPPGQYYITAKPVDTNVRSIQAYIRRPSDNNFHEQTASPMVRKRVTENGDTIEELVTAAYFPGTFDVESATLVTIRSGDNIRGADINIPEMPAARRIKGTVIDGVTGQPVTAGAVRAFLVNTGPAVALANAAIGAGGSFELTGVMAGTYYLFATPGATTGFLGGRAGRLTVQVGAKDLENVALIAPGGFNIPGKIFVEGRSDLDMTRFRIFLTPDPNGMGMPFAQRSVQSGLPDPNAVSPGGTFNLPEVGAGDFKISVQYPGVTTFMKSASIGNADVAVDGLHLEKPLEGALEIVMSTETATVRGSAVNDNNDPVPNAAIVLVPEGRLRARKDLYRVGSSDASGRLTLANVPPGDYKVFAWEEIERGAWLDPVFIRDFEARGTVVHLGAGSTESIQVTVIRSRRPQ